MTRLLEFGCSPCYLMLFTDLSMFRLLNRFISRFDGVQTELDSSILAVSRFLFLPYNSLQ